MQLHKRTYTFGVMNLAERLKAARKHAGLTQRELAVKAGITQPNISQIESGANLQSAYLNRLALACGVAPQWLSDGIGEMLDKPAADFYLIGGESNVGETTQPYRKPRGYPLISWVTAGMWEESCDNFNPGDAEEWIESDANAGRCGYWLEVKGLSMYSQQGPSFPPTMRILVQPEGFDLVSGKFYIGRLRSTGETTFKQYVRDSGVGYLAPLNPTFKTIEINDDVQIIGRVIDGKLPASVF